MLVIPLYSISSSVAVSCKKLMRIVKRRSWTKILVITLALLGLVAGYAYWSLNRPLPTLKPQVIQSQLQAVSSPSKFDWPATGQASIGIVGTGVLESNAEQSPSPTASTAKIITALVVLDKQPLAKGQQGPIITINADDVARYHSYIAQDGSVTPVTLGEQISQYQVLQTVLLPSANNMADTLAIWAYGSMDNYIAAANNYVAKHGLTQTHVGGDASGLAPQTVSSAKDLVLLGKLAMENPVVAEIVGQSTADNIPVAGTIKNVNFLLGTNGIVGVKTGNTEQAGGVFIGAAVMKINDKDVTIVSAVVGAPNRVSAMKSTLPIVDSARANFKTVPVTRSGDTVATYKLPWGGSIKAIAVKDLSLATWSGTPASTKITLTPVAADKASSGKVVGSLSVPASATNNKVSVGVKLSSAPSQPSKWWLLTHPFSD